MQSAGQNDFRLFKVVGNPYFQVRMMVAGKRRQFSTGETSERAAGAKRLDRLTTQTIDQAKTKYLAHFSADRRESAAPRTTLASVIRNASAVFSKQALAAFRAQGLSIESPFLDSKVKGPRIATYSPLPQQILENIWAEAFLLREGDPDSAPPDENLSPKQRIDFRIPP